MTTTTTERQEQCEGSFANYEYDDQKKMTLAIQNKNRFILVAREVIDRFLSDNTPWEDNQNEDAQRFGLDPSTFLTKIEIAVHDVVCNNDFNNYRGLNINRDTKEEVEFTLRFFPNVLLQKEQHEDIAESDREYPISLLAWLNDDCDDSATYHCNPHAVPFVPIFAKIGIELGLFVKEERGGLLVQDENGSNILQLLVSSCNHTKCESDLKRNNDTKHCRLVENRYLSALLELIEMNLLQKEDIREYDLLRELCQQENFPEKRFRLLCDMDPGALTQVSSSFAWYGWLTLHDAAQCSSIHGFHSVLEAGIRYFSLEEGIGLLFQKDKDGSTPFESACLRHGKETVSKILDIVLMECTTQNNLHDRIVDVIVFLALKNDVSVDGIYIMLRREPEILKQLMLSMTIATKTTGEFKDGENNNENSNINGKCADATMSSKENNGVITVLGKRKRI